MSLLNTFIVVMSLSLIGCGSMESEVRKGLPETATDIHEDFYGSFDYSRYLKAKVTEEEFYVYAKKMKYEKTIKGNGEDEGGKRVFFSWSWDETEKVNWWNPSIKLSGSFYSADIEDEFYSILKYENGYLYFKCSKT